MSNPFLRNKQQSVVGQQSAPVSAPAAPRTVGGSGFSAPPPPPQPAVQPFGAVTPVTRNIAPPPTMEAVTQQMSNVSINSAPPTTNSMAPPPASNTQGSYLSSRGRYQVPSNAYQFANASPAMQTQSNYNVESGSMQPQIAPAYMGSATNYDASAPAPAAANAAMLPDEEYVKLSYEVAPNSNSLQSLCCLPFGGFFRPMAPDGSSIPVVSFGKMSVIRCKRCRVYINPFAQFTNGGRHWKCNMCGLLNDVPNEYYASIDMSGVRVDINERPELQRGQVEFVAGSEYCTRPPPFPTYLFVIDVSYQSVASGMLQTICTAIRASIDDLIATCNNSTINVGFITFDQSVHFYQLKENALPKQMVVSDIEDVFLPIPSSLMINIVDNREVIDSFLELLPTTHKDTKNTDTCTGNALQFAGSLLQDCGGKIMVFQATLPSTGVGKLKPREAANVLGTDAEKDLLKPGIDFYNALGKVVVERQMSVDLFLGGAQYTDVSTLSSLVQSTGGQLFYYPSFQADSPLVEALYADVHRVLSRETGFEAVLRVRVPEGVTVSAFYGNFSLSHKDLMVMPVCHSDVNVALEFKIEETLNMPCFPIQAALLYTTSSGERRIRVFTTSIPTSNVLGHLFERLNQDVITALILKRSIADTITTGPAVTRHKIHQQCVSIIRGVKAQEGNLSNDPIPAKVNLIPLYFMSMEKCSAFRGGCDNKSDSRSYVFQQLQQCSIDLLLRYLYPALLHLSAMSDQSCTFADNVDALPEEVRVYGERNLILPPLLNLSVNALSATCTYLLDDGLSLWMIVGNQVDTNEMMEIFGVPSLDNYDVTNLRLPLLDTERSRKIHTLIEELRMDRPYFCPLKIVRAVDVDFNKLKWRLIEDRDVFPGGNYSYGEYIQSIIAGK